MLFRFLIFLLLVATSWAAVPLTLSQANGTPGLLKKTQNGSYEIRVAGGISLYAEASSPPPKGPLVIEFEYFCLGGIPRFAVIPGPPFNAPRAVWSAPLGHSEAWTPHRISLTNKKSSRPKNWKRLRLDLPIKKDTTLRIRNVRLRPERANEFATKESSASETTATLEAYLNAPFKTQLTEISVTPENILVNGQSSNQTNGLSLAEVPIEKLRSDPDRFVHITPITPDADGSFSLTLPRFINRDQRRIDRLTSQWQVVTDSDAGLTPISHARFANSVACLNPDLLPVKPKSKKGLGGWTANRGPKDELDRLDIASVTVNVKLERVISLTPLNSSFPIQWQGRTFHANSQALEQYDKTFREASKNGRMVSAILLLANPVRAKHPNVIALGHPDAVAEGTYAMPNVTSTLGVDFYGAALNLMAERWSRPDGKYGRVHHWIVHNEVDAGWTWTNCGIKELLPFVDLYYRSLRMVHLITRQHDPHTRPFVSLTHHWAKTAHPRFYPSRDILESLVRFTTVEGDFPWALAHHPYPQSLRKPRTWEDHQATDSFDTSKITPHNIEVLDRWMKTPAMLYLGKEVRPVHLSENGFNSPDYSKKSLHDQAAGMAYAWKKIAPLDSIEAWQYHNWIDNRHEGGLRIGLRRFPDDKEKPLGKKPIWHLYQALATPKEDEACLPYLQYINAR